jgi:hypothetical protein
MKLVYFFLVSLVVISCQNQGKMDVQAAKKATVDSMNIVIEKQRVIDSMEQEMVKIEEAKVENNREVIVVNQKAAGSTTTTTTTKKKGWSNVAKGAVIGAGVGAATGAIISKKKVQGAIIGGVAGAGVGAGTGAILDANKKD